MINVSGDPSTVTSLGLLIQPIVENAVKYAVAKSFKEGKITIDCTIGEKEVQVRIADNGPGFTSDATLHETKHGIENVRERLSLAYHKLATITCENDNGAVVTLRFPRKAPI